MAAYGCMPLFLKLLAPFVGQLTEIITAFVLGHNETGVWDNLPGASDILWYQLMSDTVIFLGRTKTISKSLIYALPFVML
jgi:hypothetical protein